MTYRYHKHIFPNLMFVLAILWPIPLSSEELTNTKEREDGQTSVEEQIEDSSEFWLVKISKIAIHLDERTPKVETENSADPQKYEFVHPLAGVTFNSDFKKAAAYYLCLLAVEVRKDSALSELKISDYDSNDEFKANWTVKPNFTNELKIEILVKASPDNTTGCTVETHFTSSEYAENQKLFKSLSEQVVELLQLAYLERQDAAQKFDRMGKFYNDKTFSILWMKMVKGPERYSTLEEVVAAHGSNYTKVDNSGKPYYQFTYYMEFKKSGKRYKAIADFHFDEKGLLTEWEYHQPPQAKRIYNKRWKE